jgi:hypothetical protein
MTTIRDDESHTLSLKWKVPDYRKYLRNDLSLSIIVIFDLGSDCREFYLYVSTTKIFILDMLPSNWTLHKVGAMAEQV